MRPNAALGAWWMITAFVCALAIVPAVAQEADETAPAVTSLPANPADEGTSPADTPLTPEEAVTLGNVLLLDPATLADGKPAKPLRLPHISEPRKFDVSRADKPDGSSTLVVKQPLEGDWDAKLGADLNFAALPSDDYRPGKPLPVTAGRQNSDAAWASVGLPNFASFDARVNPANDQGKLGTTIKKSIALGGQLSVTLQDSYSVTETFTPPATAPPPQVWNSRKDVKLDVLATGTTFRAGLATASNDPLTHNSFSAQQKLYGPLHVTTAVTDVGQPTSSKSITAGLKLNW
jgi:hypothetical protein